MLDQMRSAGLLVNALRGVFLGLCAVIPLAFVWLAGMVAGLAWPAKFPDMMMALGGGIAAAYVAVAVVAHATGGGAARREQLRIAKELRTYRRAGNDHIDLDTLAAIWSGSGDPGDYQRNLKFEQLKAAVDAGRIANPKYLHPQNKHAYIATQAPLDELEKLLIDEGVIRREDVTEKP
jgi:hypothetical protein